MSRRKLSSKVSRAAEPSRGYKAKDIFKAVTIYSKSNWPIERPLKENDKYQIGKNEDTYYDKYKINKAAANNKYIVSNNSDNKVVLKFIHIPDTISTGILCNSDWWRDFEKDIKAIMTIILMTRAYSASRVATKYYNFNQ